MSYGYPVLFDQRHLAHVTGVSSQLIGIMRRNPERFYSPFRIAKRKGGSREIHAPTPELKKLQHWIQRKITRRMFRHDASHGFAPGRSIVTNATLHVGKRVVLKLDVRDFFGSVPRQAAYRAYRYSGYSQDVADMLADLTTLDDALPQGAPTSPDLANFAAYRLDERLARYAAVHDLAYSRYADDLTFSGTFVQTNQRAIGAIMRDAGFTPNEAKLQYLLPDQRQEVTGIVVNEKANWPRSTRRWLRQEIYYLKKFGVDEHLRMRGVERGRYKEHLYGHVYALKMAQPEVAARLLAELDAVAWPATSS